MTGRHLIVILALAGVLAGSARKIEADQPPSVEKAKALFERYVELEAAFDSTIADLYSDQAVITNKRTYPTGQVRELTFPAAKYKALLRQAMPLAKQANDTNQYSDCSYSPRGANGRVEIACQRFSDRKQYTSPIRLVVGPGAAGRWVIHEEHSESIP
jgi:hypothetical protein